MSSLLLDSAGQCAGIRLSVEEIACASHTDAGWIIERVRTEQLAVRTGEPEHWRFDSDDLTRARRMASAEQMFEANGDAAAFIADLIAEIQRLRNALGPA